MVRNTLEPRQEALTALTARLLVARNDDEARGAQQAAAIHAEIETNAYRFLAVTVALLVLTGQGHGSALGEADDDRAGRVEAPLGGGVVDQRTAAIRRCVTLKMQQRLDFATQVAVAATGLLDKGGTRGCRPGQRREEDILGAFVQ